MEVTSLIIGRAGSSFSNKNLLPVEGLPLIQWTAMAGSEAKSVGKKFVSSDSKEIRESVTTLGYEPIIRPEELASSTALGCDVISHALDVMQKVYNHVPKYVLLQHANSPTILPEWIDACFSLLDSQPEASSVVPVVVEMDKHPYRQKKLLSDGTLETFFPGLGLISSNRQDLPTSVWLAHNFWLIRTKDGQLPVGEPPWTCLGPKVLGYQIEDSIDVHTALDLELAAAWLRSNRAARINAQGPYFLPDS